MTDESPDVPAVEPTTVRRIVVTVLPLITWQNAVTAVVASITAVLTVNAFASAALISVPMLAAWLGCATAIMLRIGR